MTRTLISIASLIFSFLVFQPVAWPEETAFVIEPSAQPLENLSITANTKPGAPPALPSGEERFNKALGLFKAGDYDGAASGALLAAGQFPDTPWEGRAIFLAGRAYAAKEDVDAASKVLAVARHKYPVLADYSLSLLAGLYYKTMRYDEAARTYTGLASEYPASVLVPDSLYKAGECYLKLGLHDEAISSLKRYMDIKGSASARYMLMKAYVEKGNKEAAYEEYRVLWLDYPGNANTARAEDLMQGMVEAGFVLPVPTSGDYIKRADGFFAGGSFKSALAEYRKALGLLGEGERPVGEVLLRMGLCNYHLRENDTAEYYFRKVVDNPRYSKYAPDALFWLVRTYLRTGDAGHLRDAAIRCATEYPDDKRAVDTLYLLGVSYTSDGDYDSAIEIFDTVLDSRPESGRLDEALWQLGWAEFNKGDYEASEKALNRITDEYPASELVPQALYWRARSLEALDRQGEADKCLDKAAHEYNLSFYGSLAGEKALPDYEPFGTSAPPPVKRPDERYSDTALVRAVELGLQGMGPEGVRELRSAEKRYGGSLEEAKLISGVYNYLGEYQRPLELASNLYSREMKSGRGVVPADALWMLFPRAFWGLVSKEAEGYEVDPLLVYSVIREESRFNPDIVSPAGAVGLMQLMPGTAMAVCRRMGIKYASSEQLKEEGFNLPVGVCYLKSLLEKHAGRLVFVLAEYNAGPGPLARWIEKDPGASDDVFIESIGYYETRNYVKRVLRNYYLYKRLYGAGKK